MDPSDILKRAERELRAMRYRGVIRLLEPKILLFNNDARFYYLLGSACYFTGDIQGAQLYLNKGLSCAEDDIDMRLLLACTVLRRRDTALALQLWLEVEDLNPSNKQARYGLTKLKGITNSKDLSAFINSKSFRRLLPIKPLSPIARVGFSFAYMVSIMGFLAMIGFLSFRIINQFKEPTPLARSLPDGFNFFEAPPQLLDVASDQEAIFTLSEVELQTAMQQAHNYFQSFQDDFAGRELNRIILSNASASLKNQALLLKGALQTPNFATYNANFTFTHVAAQPQLYQDLHVLWRGPINGLNINPSRIAFRLLVGYDDGKVLEGAVEVLVPFETVIAPNLITNVLGRVISDTQGNFYLEAVSINQIVQLQS